MTPEPDQLPGGPARAPRRAPRHLTSGTLTTGVLLSAACFLVAGASEILGSTVGGGEMTDLSRILSGLASLDPWAWASLGTWLVVVTPVIGLLVTAYEYTLAADRQAVGLALAVLAVLALSTGLAILR